MDVKENIALVGKENDLRNLREEEKRYSEGIENAEAIIAFAERESELQRKFIELVTDVTRNLVREPKFQYENDDDVRKWRAANDRLAGEKKIHELKLQIMQSRGVIEKAQLEVARIQKRIPIVEAELRELRGE